MMKQKVKLLLRLFGINFYISAFTFGGGYVVIPMIRKYYVEQYGFFTEEALIDMAAIAQSSPGAIAINLSALAGYRTAGISGAAIGCLGSVCPPLIILSAVSSCYTLFSDNAIVAAVLRGMEAGVAALIAGVVIDMAAAVFKEKNILMSSLVPASFIGSFVLHINVALIVIFCAVICGAAAFIKKKRGVRNAG